MQLEVRGVVHSYGAGPVLRDVSLQLPPGRIGCLLGPSGCGKTTMLRCIAGFEPVEQGEIIAAGLTLSRPGMTVPPEARHIGMVFQDFALFPHLSVGANVAFGLHAMSRQERDARTREVLEIVGMEHSAAFHPHELSGGQQQRVALARALAPRPALLLLDEPFSSLDVSLRDRLRAEVRGILRSLGTTALLVTHDQQEAFAMADEIGVMNAGQLEQWGRPHDLYHHPATPFVAGFVGAGRLLQGTVSAAATVRTALGESNAQVVGPAASGSAVQVLLRPDDLRLDPAGTCTALVRAIAFRGASVLYTLQLAGGEEVLVRGPVADQVEIGSSVGLSLVAQSVVAFGATPL